MYRRTSLLLQWLGIAGVLILVAVFSGGTDLSQAGTPERSGLVAKVLVRRDPALLEEVPRPTAEASTSLLDEIRQLEDRWPAADPPAGWVHLVWEHRLDYDATSVLPDGRVLGKAYITDDWAFVDEAGQVTTGVYIQRDLSGGTIQVSVLRDHAWYNLTYRDVTAVPLSNLPFVADFGFLSFQASRPGIALEKQMGEMEGKPVVIYSVTETFLSPKNVAEFDNPVVASRVRGYFDPVTGALVYYEEVAVLTDGSERIFNAARLIQWEVNASPPDEIMAFIEASYDGEFTDWSAPPPRGTEGEGSP